MATKRGDAPFDLDAARKTRLEAVGQGFKFKWGGKPYECPAASEWPLQVTAELSEGNLAGALELLLGEKQYGAFMKGNPTAGDIKDLFEALGEYSGVESAGNS